MKYLIATSVLIIVILSILFVLYYRPTPIINPQQPVKGNTIKTTNESKSTQVDFIQEHITIDVYPDSIAVTGIYCFRVNGGKQGIIPILYPFPVDAYHEYPASCYSDEYDGTTGEVYGRPDRPGNPFSHRIFQ